MPTLTVAAVQAEPVILDATASLGKATDLVREAADQGAEFICFPDDWELAGTPAWQAEADWNERGGSVIVAPTGEVLAGPVYEKETILTADIELEEVVAERQTFDPAGHYARGEVLDLTVHGLER